MLVLASQRDPRSLEMALAAVARTLADCWVEGPFSPFFFGVFIRH